MIQKRKRLLLFFILTFFVVLLFTSSAIISTVAFSFADSNKNIDCATSVCAYVGAGEISVIHGTKIISNISNSETGFQNAWDYSSGLLVTPSGVVINATTNTIFKIVNSSTYNFPVGALYNPVLNTVLISNSGSNYLTVINAATWKADAKTIIVGVGKEQPAFLAYNPSNREIYVSLLTVNFDECGDNVTVLSASSDKVIKTIGVSSCPAGIAFNPANNETYVANQGSGTISVINLKDQVVKTIKLSPNSQPFGVNYGDGKIYVGDRELSNVCIISASNKVKTVSGFASGPYIGAYDPRNGYEYVVDFDASEVQILIGTKISSHSISLILGPAGITTSAYEP
jgi:YVTN family beta-propeller protein